MEMIPNKDEKGNFRRFQDKNFLFLLIVKSQTMGAVLQKQQMRKVMLEKRTNLSENYKTVHDDHLCQMLWELVLLNDYRIVHAYLPMRGEIDIKPLLLKLLQTDRTVVVPKTLAGRKLQHFFLHSLAHVEKGLYGTFYPAGASEYVGEYDLIIVPGLAFDRDCFRLGYGGGYYDRFLFQHPEAYKIGIGYPFQKVKKVPVEAHDVSLDGVLV